MIARIRLLNPHTCAACTQTKTNNLMRGWMVGEKWASLDRGTYRNERRWGRDEDNYTAVTTHSSTILNKYIPVNTNSEVSLDTILFYC